MVSPGGVIAMAHQHQRRYRWFSYRFRRFLWGKETASLLAEMGCGWLDGGCLTLALALWRWFAFSSIDEGELVGVLWMVVNPSGKAQHFMVRVTYQTQDWYLDANGVNSEQHVLRHWAEIEGVQRPQLKAVDAPLGWHQFGIPYYPLISLRLAQLLYRVFGPFDPAWLVSPLPVAGQAKQPSLSTFPPPSISLKALRNMVGGAHRMQGINQMNPQDRLDLLLGRIFLLALEEGDDFTLAVALAIGRHAIQPQSLIRRYLSSLRAEGLLGLVKHLASYAPTPEDAEALLQRWAEERGKSSYPMSRPF